MQLGKEIRCFPFKNWLAWRIFLPQLPGILYFRETASPHLLPILFDRTMLETQLKLRVGSKEITQK
ncbi:putative membrane protein [Prochlorococcus sp. SS52]|nr:putative membrane protein [Prochlorococcus marinus str. LG]KGG33480.1 putative membrane protein [Prochlorococcus marinus str. SS51]KGG37398.1 putative membrane protein [Prochlorococcus sp. SS52]